MRLVLGLVALLTIAGPADAETAAGQAGGDAVEAVPRDDPAMAEAVRKAQATLPGFLDASRHPKAGTGRYAVKVGLGQAGRQEFFWLAPFAVAGDEVTGRLANEPEIIGGYAKGDLVTLPLARVTDWMYVDNGTMKGNFSACALFSHESLATQYALARHYHLDCSGR